MNRVLALKVFKIVKETSVSCIIILKAYLVLRTRCFQIDNAFRIGLLLLLTTLLNDTRILQLKTCAVLVSVKHTEAGPLGPTQACVGGKRRSQTAKMADLRTRYYAVADPGFP